MKGFFKDLFDKPIKLKFHKNGDIKEIFLSNDFKKEDCTVEVDNEKVDELKNSGFEFEII